MGLSASRSSTSAQPPPAPKEQPHLGGPALPALPSQDSRAPRCAGLESPELPDQFLPHVPTTPKCARPRGIWDRAGAYWTWPDFQLLQSWGHCLFPLATPGPGSAQVYSRHLLNVEWCMHEWSDYSTYQKKAVF